MKSCEDDAYDGNVCSETKIVILKTCEDNAYDGNVPNAILWRTKGTSSTSYEALVGEDV